MGTQAAGAVSRDEGDGMSHTIYSFEFERDGGEYVEVTAELIDPPDRSVGILDWNIDIQAADASGARVELTRAEQDRAYNQARGMLGAD